MKKFQTMLFFAASVFLSGCSGTSNDLPISIDMNANDVSVTIVDANDIQAAVNTLKEYNDTANTAWQELSKADSTKTSDIDALIKELSSGKGAVSNDELNKLHTLVQKVKRNSLKPSSQFNNVSLHHYDVLSDSLMELTLKMSSLLHKRKPSMDKLVQSILRDEYEVASKRAKYNDSAKKYNDYFWEKKSFMLQARSTLPAKPIRACFGNAG